jgi:2-polyprenyl-3-methyl-5-hydroxy-6-metoxy-1,4-benzoquinol methylase
MNCRFCGNELSFEFINLENSPPSNSFLTEEELNEPEIFYPLKLFVCDKCFLVQIDEYKNSSEIFDEKYIYFSSFSKSWLIYFSSFSKSWLSHSQNYAEMAIDQFNLNLTSLVIEIASNDGYLLQYFKNNNIPCLGIEPASKTAAVAKEKGIDVIEDYFGIVLAQKLKSEGIVPDLIIGNNVLAHVPDINDFIKALKILLDTKGVITMEFPHIMNLIELNQFDTIYHEHFSYFSFLTVNSIFKSHGLEIFDVERIPTHGGSLRIYVKHKENNSKKIVGRVKDLLELEISKKMDTLDFYKGFQDNANKIKCNLLDFLIRNKRQGKKVIAYGAAAKGNTLINFCGIKKDLIEFVVDLSPFKQNKYLPGSHIPVVNELKIKELKPDFILILPWNIKEEIIKQLDYVKDWGCKFILPIPEVKEIQN